MVILGFLLVNAFSYLVAIIPSKALVPVSFMIESLKLWINFIMGITMLGWSLSKGQNFDLRSYF